jgi:hypothetical protein
MAKIKMHYIYLFQKSTLLINKYKISHLYDHHKKFQPKLPNTDKYHGGVQRHNALTVPSNTWDKQYKISKYRIFR